MLLLALFDPWSMPSQVPSQRVFRSEASLDLSRIEYVRRGESIVAVCSAADTWGLEEPQAGAVSQNSLAQLRSALSLLRVVRSRTIQPEHELSGDDAPRLSLTTLAGDNVAVTFGSTTADGRYRWIRRESESKALLVDANLAAEIEEAAASLASLQLIPWRIERGVPLRVSLDNRWVEVTGKILRYQFPSGPVREFSVDPGLLDAWRRALQALYDEREVDCVAPRALLVTQGAFKATLDTSACVSKRQWNSVWAGFEDPQRLANLHVLPTPTPDGDFVLQCGRQRRDVKIHEVDTDSLWTWWRHLDTSAHGLSPIQAMADTCTLETGKGVIAFGTVEAQWVATRPGSSQMLILAADAKSLFEGVSELFVDTLLIDQDAVFARRMAVRDGAGLVTYQWDGEAGSWTLPGQSGSDAATADWPNSLAHTLGMLQARSFLPGAPKGGRGMGHREITVEFELPLDDARQDYEIDLLGTPSHCAVQVGLKPWAELEASECAVLWSH